MVIITRSYIWDTGAISLFFAGHKKVKEIAHDIKKGQKKGYVPRTILSEFYYKTWQKFGEQAALVRSISIRDDLLEIISIDNGDIFKIGEMKVKNTKLSLADAIIVVLARQFNSTILTTDESIEDVDNCKVTKLEY